LSPFAPEVAAFKAGRKHNDINLLRE
jgi:hypothetical protein